MMIEKRENQDRISNHFRSTVIIFTRIIVINHIFHKTCTVNRLEEKKNPRFSKEMYQYYFFSLSLLREREKYKQTLNHL
jgi:hypothetical protein